MASSSSSSSPGTNQRNLHPSEKAFSLCKDFLASVLQKRVRKFEMKRGSKDGNNFMSAIIAFRVFLEEDMGQNDLNSNEDPINVIAKSYPMARYLAHAVVNELNLFWREVNVYDEYICEIVRLQEEMGREENSIIKPPHPPYISGSAIDYWTYENIRKDACETWWQMKSYNYLMMTNLQTQDFKMVSKRGLLDFNHLALAVKELAKIHALGWVYKQKKNLPSLVSRFPYLAGSMFTHHSVVKTLRSNLDLVSVQLKNRFGSESHVMNAMKMIRRIGPENIMLSFLPPDGIIDEGKVCQYMKTWRSQEGFFADPWVVSCHGDCWTNNMLFKYEADAPGETPAENLEQSSRPVSKPIEMVFLDLQYFREGCPTTDLAVLLYTSTLQNFRTTHLDEILKIYYDTFVEICNHFEVPPLPQFSIQNLHWRFKRAKLFGFLAACFYLPIALTTERDASSEDFKATASYKQIEIRMVDIAAELRLDGII